MKKTYLTVAVAILLAGSLTFSSCVGSFALSNKVLAWNKQVSNKFVNELVFFAFWVLPVYEITAIADVLVINSIEFWSGSNPISASTKVINGQDGRYLVKCDKTGYTITSERDGSSFRFAFNDKDNSWALEKDGKSMTFMTFVDDTHVKMITPEGDFQTVELSQNGVLAYKDLVDARNFAMN